MKCSLSASGMDLKVHCPHSSNSNVRMVQHAMIFKGDESQLIEIFETSPHLTYMYDYLKILIYPMNTMPKTWAWNLSKDFEVLIHVY